MSETDDQHLRLECLKMAVQTVPPGSSSPGPVIVKTAREYLNFIQKRVSISQFAVGPEFQNFQSKLHSQVIRNPGLKSA